MDRATREERKTELCANPRRPTTDSMTARAPLREHTAMYMARVRFGRFPRSPSVGNGEIVFFAMRGPGRAEEIVLPRNADLISLMRNSQQSTDRADN